MAKTDAQARLENPKLYALRDEIARYGVPVNSANVLARELNEITNEIGKLNVWLAALSEKVAALEKQQPPHLAHVEHRG